MKIKRTIKKIILTILDLVGRTKTGKILQNVVINHAMQRIMIVNYGGIEYQFSAPNSLCTWRYDTFNSKEPETLEWIDSIPGGSILWDVGANIGLYSIYAAKKNKCKVLAFEPSIFNLEILGRNIFLNNLCKEICVVPIALSDKTGSSQMHMTTTQWGGALSSFGENFGWNGEEIEQVFQYTTIGISMTDIINKLLQSPPDYIKIDVDGIEHIILKGGFEILKNIKGILIEVNDDFLLQSSSCAKILTDAGLVLRQKRQSDMILSSSPKFKNTFNQIWSR